MNDDFKRKNQPIENQMKESWERTNALILDCQVLAFLISIIATIALVTLVCVSNFALNYSMNVIYQEIFYGFVIYLSIIGIIFLVCWISFIKIMKEYDDEPRGLEQ